MTWMMPLTQWLERQSLRCIGLRALQMAHYQARVARELQPLALPKAAKILCLGCGYLPLTAFCLAQQGFQVVAVDRDAKACRMAAEWLDQQQQCHKLGHPLVQVVCAEAGEVAAQGFQLVHLAAQIQPQQQVIQSLWPSMDKEAWLLARLPKAWLQSAYQALPAQLGQDGLWYQQKQRQSWLDCGQQPWQQVQA